jgi:hypothetical protein
MEMGFRMDLRQQAYFVAVSEARLRQSRTRGLR